MMQHYRTHVKRLVSLELRNEINYKIPVRGRRKIKRADEEVLKCWSSFDSIEASKSLALNFPGSLEEDGTAVAAEPDSNLKLVDLAIIESFSDE